MRTPSDNGTAGVEESPIAITLRNVLRAYIEDGNACSDLIERDVAPFEHISFVEWEHSTKTLRILVARVCPNCQSSIMRNVCVTHFTAEEICPLIQAKFPIVAATVPILSHDARFDDVVVKKGGSICYPSFWTTASPYHACMRYYGDLHPNIQGFMKTLMQKNNEDATESTSESLTTPQFFNRYVLCWFITSETKVLTVNGSLLHGVEEIMNGQSLLHASLRIQGCEGPVPNMITCDDPIFFSDSLYKMCSF